MAETFFDLSASLGIDLVEFALEFTLRGEQGFIATDCILGLNRRKPSVDIRIEAGVQS